MGDSGAVGAVAAGFPVVGLTGWQVGGAGAWEAGGALPTATFVPEIFIGAIAT